MKAAVGRDADRACELIAKHIQSTTDNVIKYASELIGDGQAGRGRTAAERARFAPAIGFSLYHFRK